MRAVVRWIIIVAAGCLLGIVIGTYLARPARAVEFEPPDQATRIAAIGETKYSPVVQKRAFAESPLFTAKSEPEPMDWLANQPENGQTFDQFLQTRRNLFQPPRQTLYIQPLGAFTKEQTDVLEEVTDYSKVFFQAEVRVQKAIDPATDEGITITSRKHPGPNDLQFLSTDILDLLKQEMPKDAYARIAVTMTDLYPDPTWNFVFGQASPSQRVGVYSFARYGEPGVDQFLRRCLRVFAHETGHMFAVMHCIHYQCLMNGSNHMAESDATPLQLCPVCLRKLHAANTFNIRERYEKLGTFFNRSGFKSDAEWIRNRLVELDWKP